MDDLVRVKQILSRNDYNLTTYQFLGTSNEVLFTNKHFIVKALKRYGLWWYYNVDYDEEATDETNLNKAIALFQLDFQNWIEERKTNFTKMFNALAENYDPTHNYSRTEEGGIIMELHKGTKKSVGSNVTTEKHKGTKTAVNANMATEKHKGTKTSTNIDNTLEKHKGSKAETNSNLTVEKHKGTKTTNASKSTELDYDTNYDNSLINNQKKEITNGANDNYTTVQDISGSTFDKDVTTGTGANNYTTYKDIDSNTYDYDKATATASNNYTKVEDIDSTHFDKDVSVGNASDNYKTVQDIDATHFDKDVVVGNATDNFVTIQDIDANTFNKNVVNYDDYHVFGTIGVNNIQDMLQKELSLRQINLIDEFIKDFFFHYTFYLD